MAEKEKKAAIPKPRKTAVKKSTAKTDTALTAAVTEIPHLAASAETNGVVHGANGTAHAETKTGVSHEQVAVLAHRFWGERGHQHGHHVDDWLRAEQELRGKAS